MQKYIFSSILILIIICCGDNSTEPQFGNDPALVGNWELVSVKVDDEYYDPDELGDFPLEVLFNADGSGQFENTSYEESFSWKTSAKQLYIDGEDVMNYSIYGETLILSFQEDGENFEITFEKYTEPQLEYDPELVGTWQLISVKVDDEYFNPGELTGFPATLSFEPDGSGKFGSGAGEEFFNWNTYEGKLYLEGEDAMGYAVYGVTLILSFQDGDDSIELTYGK